MRLVLALVVAVVLAALSAGALLSEPGYVLIRYGPWTVEATLAVAVVALLLLYAALHYVWRLTRGVRRLPRGLRRWRGERRRHRAVRSLVQGLVELAEGHWEAAERLLTRDVADSEAPLVHYLGAARAAQGQGARERRDEYLRLAGVSRPASPLAVALTQAELQEVDGQHERALASCLHARNIAPRHPVVLARLAELYRRLGDHEALARLAPELRRARALPPQAVDTLEREAWRAVLEGASAKEVLRLWARLPRGLREEPALVEACARGLAAGGETAEAERLLQRALGRRREPALVALYGTLSGEGAERRLSQLERWLAAEPDDPALLLAAGRQALMARLWGKARDYLEAAVARGGDAEARLELAALLESLGEDEAAREQYRLGLEAHLGRRPSLPADAPPRPLPAAGEG